MQMSEKGASGRCVQTLPDPQSLAWSPNADMQARTATPHAGGGTVLVGTGVHCPPLGAESGMIIDVVPASQSAPAVVCVQTPGKYVF